MNIKRTNTKQSSRLRENAAFTLIELLVVIEIIAILARLLLALIAAVKSSESTETVLELMAFLIPPAAAM